MQLGFWGILWMGVALGVMLTFLLIGLVGLWMVSK